MGNAGNWVTGWLGIDSYCTAACHVLDTEGVFKIIWSESANRKQCKSISVSALLLWNEIYE